jgi:hypothetical protein
MDLEPQRQTCVIVQPFATHHRANGRACRLACREVLQPCQNCSARHLISRLGPVVGAARGERKFGRRPEGFAAKLDGARFCIVPRFALLRRGARLSSCPGFDILPAPARSPIASEQSAQEQARLLAQPRRNVRTVRYDIHQEGLVADAFETGSLR